MPSREVMSVDHLTHQKYSVKIIVLSQILWENDFSTGLGGKGLNMQWRIFCEDKHISMELPDRNVSSENDSDLYSTWDFSHESFTTLRIYKLKKTQHYTYFYQTGFLIHLPLRAWTSFWQEWQGCSFREERS